MEMEMEQHVRLHPKVNHPNGVPSCPNTKPPISPPRRKLEEPVLVNLDLIDWCCNHETAGVKMNESVRGSVAPGLTWLFEM